jgi:hypothetical protein
MSYFFMVIPEFSSSVLNIVQDKTAIMLLTL